MKIAIWKTGHEIADTVAEAMHYGLKASGQDSWCIVASSGQEMIEHFVSNHDIHIGYGILRGMDDVFRACDRAGKPWFNIDKGYFKPGHYNGYYRVSLRGTQQTTGLDKLQPDYERLDALGVELLPPSIKSKGNVLICPPTDYVRQFFNLPAHGINWLCKPELEQQLIRDKHSQSPLQRDLDWSGKVITFNSSVGWEAMRQGIPVISDPAHSIIGAYQKMLMDRGIQQHIDFRRELFGIMAGLQLTLDEMRQGLLWPLMQRLMSSSDMTPAKP